MPLKLTNNASSLLSASINSGQTTLTITSGHETLFPSLSAGDWHPLTVVDASNNIEIMRCTGRSGVTLTVVRGQEGTTATSFAAGARVELRLTAAALAEKLDASAAWAVAASLGSGVDLDAITTPGVYKQNNSANAAGGTNYPIGFAGTLEVFDGGAGIMQRYTVFRTTTTAEAARVYVRAHYSGIWSAWRRVASADDLAAKIDIAGHAAVSVVGRSANSSGDAADIPAAANDRMLARVSNALSWVQLTIGMIPDTLITFAKMASGAVATFAEFNSATASKLLSTASVWSDLAVLTDAATIAVNINNGYDFGAASNAPLALGGNRTLGAPTNVRNSKKGVLWFTATGATRTLTLDAAWILFDGVEVGPYSITTSQLLGVAYVCRGTTVEITNILRRPL